MRAYVENRPRHGSRGWNVLFPDSCFPKLTEEPRLCGKHTVLRSSELNENLAQNARDLLSKMLTIDPKYRISVEDALRHNYVNIWFDSIEVDAPPSGRYDPEVESVEHSVEEWKCNQNQILDANSPLQT